MVGLGVPDDGEGGAEAGERGDDAGEAGEVQRPAADAVDEEDGRQNDTVLASPMKTVVARIWLRLVIPASLKTRGL